MSLFGEDAALPPSSSARHAKASLFDDGPASTPSRNSQNNTHSSSIFADTGDSTDSPWGFTPSKRNVGGGATRSAVRTLLADAEVPELYIDVFDALQEGGSVSAAEARRSILDAGGVRSDADKIWSLLTAGDTEPERLGRSEVNVLVALVGLAQEREELSLDAVDERRRELPVPDLPGLRKSQVPSQQQSEVPRGASHGNGIQKQAFGTSLGDSDPWGSPQAHRAHGHGESGGFGHRTTSSFTTNSAPPPPDGAGSGGYGSGDVSAGSGTGAGAGTGSWRGSNAYSGNHTESFGNAGASGQGDGFSDEGNGSGSVRRPAPPRTTTGKGVEEVVTVNFLGEKEGMFMFQHRNYEVASVRRNSKVIRRYSDFVWLLDCLHKRYPFRQLPLLPPKRVAINGNHIAADSTFLEKRRRGLVRFANALVRHPVLREEQLVVMFLTVPTELAVWRKQATISVQEEFVGRTLPPALEDSLPQNLQETFDTVRSGVRRSADLYINMCNLVERLCKRKEALASEYGRMTLHLNSITETSSDSYAIDQNDVTSLNEGIKGTAKHIGTSQSLLEDEARAWDEGVLEDLKAMRDSLVSIRDMFDRRDRLARDNIPQLERRIQMNEQKLQSIVAKGDAAKPGEAEKTSNAITADKQSIVDQHARGVFIRECVRDELLYFQSTQYHVSRLHQEWAQERVKYAELQADNFRAMVDTVERMPLGEE